MSDALHTAKKRELWAYIQRSGEIWGEDTETIKSLATDVYLAYKGNLEPALECFKGLIWLGELIITSERSRKSSETSVVAYKYLAKSAKDAQI